MSAPPSELHPYDALTPDLLLDALETTGLRCDGRLLALNSYENRVYQVGIEDATPVIAKFYRPGRWSRAALQEEHDFAWELVERDIPVVAPQRDVAGRSLHEHGGFAFAVYPRQGGRWPDLDQREHRVWMGRFLGRLHAVGRTRPFSHRPTLDVHSFGQTPRDYLLDKGILPDYLEAAYRSLVDELLQTITRRFAECGPVRNIRLHGDCHPGNILWTDNGPHFVDLDDCRMGPAVQDLWMLLSGDREEMGLQLGALLEGYEDFCDFDYHQLSLIEPLRTLRIIHYAGWLASRADDPAFQQAFPWFYGPRYWEEHILSLREQAAALDEPVLSPL
ncbi:MAG: serine/threonine protein kinase [Gammaproteobacteria bacterium]|nr:serine/threonine protein kinase [Gammaproteobacteria bacterium]